TGDPAGECGVKSDFMVLTIQKVPDASAVGQSICSGSSTNIVITNPNLVSGTTFSWTIGTVIGTVTGQLPGSGTAIIQALTSSAGGSVEYLITPSSNGCPGSTISAIVSVDPIPVGNPVGLGTHEICSGAGLNIVPSSNVVGATYTWTGSNGSGGTGNITDAPLNSGNNALTVTYTVTPRGPGGTFCVGAPFTIQVLVNPSPEFTITIVLPNICSGCGVDITLNSSTAGHQINLVSVDYAGGNVTGGGASGPYYDGNQITEVLSNVTNMPQIVTYTFNVTTPGTTPVCPLVPINKVTTVTVNPEPVGVAATKTVCSDVSIDYNLLTNVATLGNNVGSTFSWVAADNTDPDVTGESTVPVIGPIITDVITNLTNINQDVIYTVTPTSTNGCVGTPFTITVTIKPEPVGVSTAAPDICSGSSVNYDLQNNVNVSGNVLASNFTWTAAPNANVTGETTSLKSGAIIDDVLTNTTTVDQVVTYTVTPTGQVGGCQGNPFTIDVIVNPRAIFSAGPNLSVCVDQADIQIMGSVTFAPASYSWSGGTFDNPSLPNPKYILSPADMAVTVPTTRTLTLTVAAAGACAAEAKSMTLTINPLPIVVFSGFPAGSPPQMAENNAPITLTGNQIGGVFTISPATSNIGSTVPSPVDKATFDPSAVDLGSNFVTYTYTDPNGCLNATTQEVIVNPVTTVDFTMQYTFGSAPFPFVPLNGLGEFELCANVGLVKLIGNPVASSGLPPETQFTSIPAFGGGPVASIIFDGTDYFMQTNGLVSQTYRIQYTYKNAFNAITTKIRDVKIFASPTAVISVLNNCIDSAINFADGSTIPPSPFGGSISSWQWNFGVGEGASNQQNPSYIYSISGNKLVSLTTTTTQGCSNSTNLTVRVGDVPVVDYAWSAICNNDQTKFLDETNPGSISNITNYTWDFGDGDVLTMPPATNVNDPIPPTTHGGRTTGTYKDPEHAYAAFGTYDTQLTVDTDDGCNNSLIQRVFILPFSTVTPLANAAYLEDFEVTNGGWVAEANAPSDTSWVWGIPSGTTINSASSGTKAWWTGKNSNTYFPNEESVVNGPCFNLTQLARPMIALDYWSDTENNVDGAVLQYSTDGGINWNIVGPPVGQVNRDEGINWFNGVTIPSNPGSQPLGSYGWTNKLGGWLNGRFNLDMIPNAQRDQVRLRIAFASNDLNPTGQTFDGFAFDNVFVGNKTRNVLVEHFTNNNLPASVDGDVWLDDRLTDQFAIRSVSDFNDVRYHISFPTPDQFNQENPADPGARASYYNVSQSPSTIMDGKLDGVKFKGKFTDITTVEVDRRALVTPLFNLALDSIATNNNNTITPRLTITATQAFSAPLIAQVALVEKTVNGSRNVVRKQLFGADGLTVNTPWTAGQTIVQTKADVVINVPIVNSGQLELVGYIQDKNTKEIYQSIVVPAPIKRGSVIVGLEDEPFDPVVEQITLFPNPANGEFNFTVPDSVQPEYRWRVADQRGVVLIEGDFSRRQEGVLSVEINDLPNGVYHVIITGKGDTATYRKLVVMNRN
ncbi:MAG: PKD-like domain-containing protein, partial [Cyclobacteriaceae bacterium]